MFHMPQLREIPPRSATPALMGLPTPQPTPPAATTMPPPRPAAPLKAAEVKQLQGVTFRDLLHGPAITIHIGPEVFTLPFSILCTHSSYFRQQIRDLVSTPSKKRKMNLTGSGEDDDDDAKEKQPTRAKSDLALELRNLDPDIFVLFLKFIYTGGYHPNVDGRPTTTSSISDATAPYAPPFAQPPYPPPITGPNTAVYAPSPNPNEHFIPPSIHAYLLAQRLRSISFMNHTLSRIYSGIGTYFPLSPSLINFVWVQTTAVSSTIPSTEPGSTIWALSPIRRLLLDVLIMHWPTQHTNIIARDAPAAWNMLFDAHRDLRQEFILGLQDGKKVAPVLAYFAGQTGVVKQEGH